ncbi:MAG: GAF domain-containing protein [Candidatus Eisenbacteria bacterium]|uniref:GAF domain-containing protein n=1 Tax=Eiseniibacteriota bacterium TaxID=2212470 RepID=A0A7Y2E8D5_UNCEI|nr:GAF domain-containing protein [Candidatus Eisenbacteria bacterium]
MQGDAIVTHLEEAVRGGMKFQNLLEKAVELIHECDENFHWTGIYELYPDGMLRLGPFIGAPTDHVFIGVGEGVCGTAVKEEKNQNIPDVMAIENYLACSTQTRSELVVLIRDEKMIYAQVDLDSHIVDAFAGDVEGEVQKVADFLAKQYRARASQKRAA